MSGSSYILFIKGKAKNNTVQCCRLLRQVPNEQICRFLCLHLHDCKLLPFPLSSFSVCGPKLQNFSLRKQWNFNPNDISRLSFNAQKVRISRMQVDRICDLGRFSFHRGRQRNLISITPAFCFCCYEIPDIVSPTIMESTMSLQSPAGFTWTVSNCT